MDKELKNSFVLEAQKGNIDARNKVIVDSTGLVHFVLKQYKQNTVLNYDDLYQEGILGLFKAIENYDPQISSFSTYACQWIKANISKAIYENQRQIGKTKGKINISLEELIQNEEESNFPSMIEIVGNIESVYDDIAFQDLLKIFEEVFLDKEIQEKVIYKKNVLNNAIDMLRSTFVEEVIRYLHEEENCKFRDLTKEIKDESQMKEYLEKQLVITNHVSRLDLFKMVVGLDGFSETSYTEASKFFNISVERARQIFMKCKNNATLKEKIKEYYK